MAWQRKSISERHAAAQSAGRKAAKVNKYPLRAALGRIDHPAYPNRQDMPVVALECGHWLHLRNDGSYPVRRRCYKCAKGLPPDVPGHTA